MRGAAKEGRKKPRLTPTGNIASDDRYRRNLALYGSPKKPYGLNTRISSTIE